MKSDKLSGVSLRRDVTPSAPRASGRGGPPTPPASAVHRLLPKNPKCEKRLAVLPPTRPPPPPWLPLSIAARPPSRHITLALRSKTSPTFVLAWQWNRSANNGMLLPHHITPPILAPPCSCFASAYRIRLRQRCLIIATRPRPVCSESTVVPLSPLDRIPVCMRMYYGIVCMSGGE